MLSSESEYHKMGFLLEERRGELMNPACISTGIFEVNCIFGKDRTGFVIAVLEGLMGASYEEIASVNRHGKIKARSKGKCYVYAYAQNGAGKKVLVIVK